MTHLPKDVQEALRSDDWDRFALLLERYGLNPVQFHDICLKAAKDSLPFVRLQILPNAGVIQAIDADTLPHEFPARVIAFKPGELQPELGYVDFEERDRALLNLRATIDEGSMWMGEPKFVGTLPPRTELPILKRESGKQRAFLRHGVWPFAKDLCTGLHLYLRPPKRYRNACLDVDSTGVHLTLDLADSGVSENRRLFNYRDVINGQEEPESPLQRRAIWEACIQALVREGCLHYPINLDLKVYPRFTLASMRRMAAVGANYIRESLRRASFLRRAMPPQDLPDGPLPVRERDPDEPA